MAHAIRMASSRGHAQAHAHDRHHDPLSSVLDSACPVVTREEAVKLHVAPRPQPSSASPAVASTADGDAAGARAPVVATDGAVATASAPAGAAEPYYWSEGGTPTPINLITHNVHWLSVQLFSSVEYVGEVLADFFGLFNARYEWAAEAERQRVVRGKAKARRCTPAANANAHHARFNVIPYSQAALEEEELQTAQQARWREIREMNAAAQPAVPGVATALATDSAP